MFHKNSQRSYSHTDIVARSCRVVALLYANNANKTVSLYLPSSKANFNYLYKLDKQAARNLILATRQLFSTFISLLHSSNLPINLHRIYYPNPVSMLIQFHKLRAKLRSSCEFFIAFIHPSSKEGKEGKKNPSPSIITIERFHFDT